MRADNLRAIEADSSAQSRAISAGTEIDTSISHYFIDDQLYRAVGSLKVHTTTPRFEQEGSSFGPRYRPPCRNQFEKNVNLMRAGDECLPP